MPGSCVLLASAPVVGSRNEVALPGMMHYPLVAQDKLPFEGASLHPLINACLLSNFDQMLSFWWRKSKGINPTLYFTEKCVQTPLISTKLQLCTCAESLKQQILVSWSPSRLWSSGHSGVKVYTFFGHGDSGSVNELNVMLMSPL